MSSYLLPLKLMSKLQPLSVQEQNCKLEIPCSVLHPSISHCAGGIAIIMLSTIWLLLFCGIISEHLASSQKSTKVKKNNLKVHINATGNTLVMKFLRPNENLKLEGFVLGYGSNFFSNQYIQWPENGKSYLTEVDAEPRYLIAVKPNENSKKSCKEKNSAMKPLQLVVGTLTPTSAFLSWGILINPQIDWSVLNKCPNDRFYTVRYREKNKDWLYQLCPTTEIVIDSLKPSTMYEFGVKDNTENGIWSKSYNHKTVQKSKENGQIQSTNTISKAVLRMAPEDTKALIPVTVIKQGFLNLTHFIQPKSTSEPTTTEKHKATQLPTTPKTTKKPDTEVYKPAVTSQPIVEYVTTDSPNGVLEWFRGTMESLESQSVYPSSKTVAYVNQGEPQNNPAIQHMSTASFQPKNTHIERSIPTPATVGMPLVSRMSSTPDVTSPKAQPGSTQEKENDIFTQEPTKKTETANVMDISPEIYPIPTDVPEVSSNIPLEHHRTTVGLPLIPPTFLSSASATWESTEEQTSSIQATGINEPYTEDDSDITENPETGNGLPLVQSTISSTAYVTMKKTPAPEDPTSLTPGLPLIPPTFLSSASVTWESTEEQTSSIQATGINEPYTEDDSDITENPETGNGLPLVQSTIFPTAYVTMKKTPAPEDPTSLTPEIFPASPDDRQVRPYTPFEQLRTTMGLSLIPSTSSPALDLAMKVTPVPGVQTSTSQAEKYSESADLPQQSTHVPVKQQSTTLGKAEIVPESTEVPQVSTDKLHTHFKTTEAAREKQSVYIPATISSWENQQTPHESSVQTDIYSSPPFQTIESPTVELVKSLPVPTKSHHIAKTEVPVVLYEIPYLQTSKPSLSTEAPQMEAGKNSTQSVSKTITTEATHTFEQERVVATTEEQYVQDLETVSKTETEPTTVFKESQTVSAVEEARTTEVQTETIKISSSPSAPKETLATENPLPKLDPKETHQVSIKLISVHLIDDPLAPYKPQHSSSRPRTSVGSKIRTVSSPPFPPVRPTMRKRPNATNVTGRPGNVLVPRAPSTARPNRTTVSIKAPMQLASSAPPEGTVEATVFSPTPKSELDALGKIRTTGPHIIYMGKKEFEPCSITESLKHFPTEEATNQEIVSRPLNPPSNLTIVTVEGCPSFVILDWEHPENETVTEYKVISTENGAPPGKDQSIITTNQTFSTVENLKANASYQFLVVPSNPLGEGPASNTVEFSTESADPRVSEPVTAGKDAIWTQIKFKSDSYSECKGKQFVKRTWYKKFVGIQLCNSLRYKIYLSDSLLGTFYNIGDQSGFGEDHCQFVDSFLDGRTGQQLLPEQLKTRKGFYRAVRQQPVEFGEIGGYSQIRYVHWYECGIAIPGKW
ncbi:target of Nesh-SH3 isoform X36 [Xenopus laevis]|uniref:Target of Nesh-SH3 isoform X36 n=1 Tax=Xenopus laevis TaxID=8355 RepID=A0A8J1M999_XENLA|nr:target of Nesh-SH3 isoform X36 [Xenopus laevis]